MNKKKSEIEYYKLFWKNAFDFKGRATRSEYWWAYGINYIVSMVAGFFGPLALVFGLATIIPTISVTVRRFHDVGKPMTIPVIGMILGGLSFVFMMIMFYLMLAIAPPEQNDTLAGTFMIIAAITFAATFIIALVTLYYTVKPSQPFDNQYGRYKDEHTYNHYNQDNRPL